MLSWLNSFDDCCPLWAASSWGYERLCGFQHLFISVECLAHGWKDIVLGRVFEVILKRQGSMNLLERLGYFCEVHRTPAATVSEQNCSDTSQHVYLKD